MKPDQTPRRRRRRIRRHRLRSCGSSVVVGAPHQSGHSYRGQYDGGDDGEGLLHCLPPSARGLLGAGTPATRVLLVVSQGARKRDGGHPPPRVIGGDGRGRPCAVPFGFDAAEREGAR